MSQLLNSWCIEIIWCMFFEDLDLKSVKTVNTILHESGGSLRHRKS